MMRERARLWRLMSLPIMMGMLVNVTSCRSMPKERPVKENIADREHILEVVQNYPRALETGDAQLWQGLFWLDDPNFTIVENDRPHVMGREYIDSLTDMIRRRGAGPPAQRWYATKVYFLAPDLAYTVSLRDELNIKKTSRVTLILAKKDREWRMLHAHFSFVPE